MQLLRTTALAVGLFAAWVGTAMSEDASFVVFPTADIKLNTGLFATVGKDSDWSKAIRAYTDTSEQAVSAWCNGISSSHPALAVSAKSMSEIGIASCPSADSGHAMTIKVPKSKIPGSYGDVSSLDGEHLYLFLRSQSSNSHAELSGVGQKLLWEPYKDEAASIFSDKDRGPNDDFFPNFCQMCGCCTQGLE